MTRSTEPMTGLHHVTAISGPAQANVDFFTRLMDQRLVKKTVNFDDPGTYHLYYGNRTADPGTILTFFPFAGAAQGRPGPGMASAYGYAVGDAVMDDWLANARDRGAQVSGVTERFGQRVARIADPDGASVELIGTPGDHGPAEGGFHGVTLWLDDLGPTRDLLVDRMGYEEAGHETGDGAERLRLCARRATRVARRWTSTAATAPDAASLARARCITWRSAPPTMRSSWIGENG